MQAKNQVFVKFFRALKTIIPALNLPKTPPCPAKIGRAEFISAFI
jgi:hypothetical protein